jgi:acetoin utilization deacetylase AcuC-like enzyme
VILFGAFDRHNFGDLLLGEIAASVLQDRPLVFAGLAERDRRVFSAARALGVPVAVAMAGGYARNIDDTVRIHATTIWTARGVLG